MEQQTKKHLEHESPLADNQLDDEQLDAVNGGADCTCPICGASFKNPYSLRGHAITTHNIS